MSDWWSSVPSHQRGIEISGDQKEGTGRYRALEELRCRECSRNGRQARVILALYAGEGGQVWLWLSGYRGLVNHPDDPPKEGRQLRGERIPPAAFLFVVGFRHVAVCQNCRYGQPFLVEADGINTDFEPAPPTFGRVAEG